MKTILFIHDTQEDPWQRKQLLESVGFHVDMVRDGQSALSYLEHSLPDAVLMDVLLEGPTGFDVCRSLRKKYTSRQFPVVLCSQIYQTPTFRNEAFAAGAQAYLQKPVPLRRLVDEITRVMENPQANPVQEISAIV